jgi:methylglyoxal synthase
MAERNNLNLLKLCDIHNVPVATNIATAEILVRALERGDIDWREIVNPRSEYNLRKKSQNYSR